MRAALDHAVPEFAGAAGGEGFGDAAYLDVAKSGFLHFLFEAFGVFQCADGALRLRQVWLDTTGDRPWFLVGKWKSCGESPIIINMPCI